MCISKNTQKATKTTPTKPFIGFVCLLLYSVFLALFGQFRSQHWVFLGEYQGYINWASFFIAFSIYYYYRLSPVLSYVMLLLMFVFSGGIIALEKWEQIGGPAMWQSCLGIFVLAWAGQFIGHKIEGKKPSFFDDLKFLLIGPIWLIHFLFKKAGIKY